MADFARLVEYFRRPDVEELILQTGKVIAIKLNGQLRPLTRTPLSEVQLASLVGPTALGGCLGRLDRGVQEVELDGPDGLKLRAKIWRGAQPLSVRVYRAAPQPNVAPGVPESSDLRIESNAISIDPEPTPPPRTPETAGDLELQADSGPSLELDRSQPQLADEGDHFASPSQDSDYSNYTNHDPAPVPSPAPRTSPSPSPGFSSPDPSITNIEQTAKRAEPPPPVRSAQTSAPAGDSEHSPDERAVHLSADPPATIDYRLRELLHEGRRLDASDIHLVSDRKALVRRFGNLAPHGEILTHDATLEMLVSALSPRDRDQFERLGYADFALEDEVAGRFRANLCRHKYGVKGCFRVLPNRPYSMDELGLPHELSAVLDYHQGLAIVAGPNGQGKSTTLAALVDLLNRNRAVHIITVEDPVEVLHPIAKAVISQRQVGRDTRSFHSALKAALREDPDVIVIGELRDRETVEMALSAAETGHLVIATMNTPSGAKTIGRLIDLFPPDDQAQVRATLAGALMIVAAQRLVPNADRTRRVAAVELITGGIPLWSLIRDSKLFQLPGLMQRGRRMGMIRLEDSLRELFAAGTIDEMTMQRAIALERGANADDPTEESETSPAAANSTPTPDSPPQGRVAGLRGLLSRKS